MRVEMKIYTSDRNQQKTELGEATVLTILPCKLNVNFIPVITALRLSTLHHQVFPSLSYSSEIRNPIRAHNPKHATGVKADIVAPTVLRLIHKFNTFS